MNLRVLNVHVEGGDNHLYPGGGLAAAVAVAQGSRVRAFEGELFVYSDVLSVEAYHRLNGSFRPDCVDGILNSQLGHRHRL